MKDFIIAGLVDWMGFQEHFRLEFNCVVTEDMKVPKHIKEKFGIGNDAMFVISDIHPNVEFDFDNSILSWDSSFSGIPYRIELPTHCIKAVGSPHMVLLLHDLIPPGLQKRPEPEYRKTVKTEPPELKVVHFDDSIPVTKSTANLKVVPCQTPVL